jgi:hypothetical protein
LSPGDDGLVRVELREPCGDGLTLIVDVGGIILAG